MKFGVRKNLPLSLACTDKDDAQYHICRYHLEKKFPALNIQL